MAERETRATALPLKIGKTLMTRVARAIERGEKAGLMKFIVDAKSDRIGPHLTL
jgi:pyruvate/2-oxoglutarate dehydrogenase complex dihydrolipoamide dehydrogenase (E3) component